MKLMRAIFLFLLAGLNISLTAADSRNAIPREFFDEPKFFAVEPDWYESNDPVLQDSEDYTQDEPELVEAYEDRQRWARNYPAQAWHSRSVKNQAPINTGQPNDKDLKLQVETKKKCDVPSLKPQEPVKLEFNGDVVLVPERIAQNSTFRLLQIMNEQNPLKDKKIKPSTFMMWSLCTALCEGAHRELKCLLEQMSTKNKNELINRKIDFAGIPRSLHPPYSHRNLLSLAVLKAPSMYGEILLDHGADPAKCDAQVFSLAFKRPGFKVAQRIAQMFKEGDKALDELFDAARNNMPQYVDSFVEKAPSLSVAIGAGLDSPQENEKVGDTPLHIAARKGHAEMVKKLLQVGANSFIKNGENEDGDDCLEVATNEEVRKLILQDREYEKTLATNKVRD